jgi:hypothetical protein
MDGSSQLEVLILNQRRAMAWYVGFAGAVAFVGLTVLVFALSGPLSGEPLKAALGVGGGFISAISGFPIKEVRRCQDRIAVYRELQAQLTAASEEDRQRIHTIVWDAVKSIAVGS